jgi:hypothetical protein
MLACQLVAAQSPHDRVGSGRNPVEAIPLHQLPFIANHGQFGSAVDFRADAGGATIWLTPGGVFYQFVRSLNPDTQTNLPPGLASELEDQTVEQLLIRMSLVGGSMQSEAIPEDRTSLECNYLRGAEPSGWVHHVPTYRTVTYPEVYPGIDLRFKGTSGHLEYDFEVAPSADPSTIRVRFQGADSLRLDPSGNLIIHSRLGSVVERAPISYQLDGLDSIPRSGGYLLFDDNTFGFDIDDSYDPSLPLIIDPVVTFSSFLGGSLSDYGRAITVDDDSCMYIAGYVVSVDFPLASPFDSTYNDTLTGHYDAFISKISGDGDELLFSTYLGGTEANDRIFDIAIDADRYVYVCGVTEASDFPVVNAFQATLEGPSDAFLAKLSQDGSSLEYATYFGGSGTETGGALAVDVLNRPCMAGNTSSPDLDLPASPFDATLDGDFDAFFCRLSADGLTLEAGGYLGGTSNDRGSAIATDTALNLYVAGYTDSDDFPATGGFDSTYEGGVAIGDAFLVKFNNDGDSIIYSTYLGGSNDDVALGLAVDDDMRPHVTGYTFSSDYPQANLYVSSFDGLYSGFVTKLEASGDALVYSGFLAGSGEDVATDIAIDHTGAAHVSGHTSSSNFPIHNGVQTSFYGSIDAFATCIEPDGTGLVYSTYLGAISLEFAYGVAVDASRNTYLVGYTDSPSFLTVDPYQGSLAGGYDVFVTRIALEAYDCIDSDFDGFGDPGHPDNDCPDDNCPDIANADQADIDTDAIGDVCDNCPVDANASQSDLDSDGIGDSCDTCTDTDGDGFGNPGFGANTCAEDNCPDISNPDQLDSDDDGLGDLCDECTDLDGDGHGDPGFPANTCGVDNCPDSANADQADADLDSYGDVCDNCPLHHNSPQADYDSDGVGDSCDTCTDYDDDGYGNPDFPANTCEVDNCPFTHNPDQADADSNGVGDACDIGCCMGVFRGNIDMDPANQIAITDLIYLVTYMFQGGPEPPCPEEANIDGDPTGMIDITDLIMLVQYMFQGGDEPADCS